MKGAARAIATHPWLVLGIVAALSAPAAFYASRVVIDSSAESLVRADAPDTQLYRQTEKLFGTEEVDAVLLLGDDVFNTATLAKIKRLDEKISAVRDVDSVQSLASVDVVSSMEDGAIQYAVAMAEAPKSAEALAALRDKVRRHPFLRGTFVSNDGRGAMLLVTYRKMDESQFVKSGVVDRVRAVIAEETGPEEIYLIGGPTMRDVAARMMQHDMATFAPATSVIICLVLFAAFRSVRGVLLPLATVGIGILWMMGLMGFVGAKLDVIGLVLPSLLLAVGSAYATHLVATYYDEAERGGTRQEIVTRVLGHLGLPVFVTGFATVVGFGSLMVYRIPAIRNFGIYSTFGIAALFLLALTFTAAVLAVLPLPKRRAASSEREWPWLRRVLDSIVAFDLRNRRVLLVVTVGILGAFLVKIPSIELDTNYISYFPRNSPERAAADAVDKHFGGSVNFFVAINAEDEGELTKIDMLRRIEALEDFVRRIPGVGGVSSIADVVKLVRRGLNDDSPEQYALPDNDSAVQQYLLLLPPEATEQFMLPDATRSVIRVRATIRSSQQLNETIERIETFAASLFPSRVEVKTTGIYLVSNKTADELSTGQVSSLALALAVVFVIMSAFFVSIRLGLVAMLPNLVPIVIYFGLLGWLEIPLGISTAIIASMVLGLGVDEAIHLLSEFNARVREHGDQERAIHEAMATVGPPVVFTTVSLTLGFLAQALSGFLPIQQFAYLSALNVFTSLLADLFLTPAFVASVRFVTLWDLMTLKLGKAPERTIPLFEGLRPSQARIALLMGQLRNVHEGDRIVAQGEPGDEMFVLVSGSAEVRTNGPHGPVAVATLGRGAVIGEMGLLRHESRTADVVALEPSEVLRVDQQFFEVLLRRYPKIAGVLLFNLSRILSEKVASTTRRYVERVDRDGELSSERRVAG